MYLEGTKYKDIRTGKVFELVGDESCTSWYLFIKDLETKEIKPCPEDVFIKRFIKA